MTDIRLETKNLALACDCHMHIWDPRFPLGPAHTPTRDATVADYLRVRERLGLGRVVVVQSTAYGTDNECTLDAIRQMGDRARGVAIVAPDVPDAELARMRNACQVPLDASHRAPGRIELAARARQSLSTP